MVNCNQEVLGVIDDFTSITEEESLNHKIAQLENDIKTRSDEINQLNINLEDHVKEKESIELKYLSSKLEFQNLTEEQI